jgi:hypothetical protein
MIEASDDPAASALVLTWSDGTETILLDGGDLNCPVTSEVLHVLLSRARIKRHFPRSACHGSTIAGW